jgi:putative NADPH-quinone reductase
MTDATPRAIVVLAHPRRGSLNHALAASAVEAFRARGIPVDFHDLYAEHFDPILREAEAYTAGESAPLVLDTTDRLLREHRKQLSEASFLVVVHPNWWGMPPAILTGWLDRTFVPGVAYELPTAGGIPIPMLPLRRLVILNTSDTAEERELAWFGDPLDTIWRRGVAPFVGSPVVERRVFRVVADSTAAQRAGWLRDVAELVAALPE